MSLREKSPSGQLSHSTAVDVAAGGFTSAEVCADEETTPVEDSKLLWPEALVSPGVPRTNGIACADGRMADDCEPESTGAVALALLLICDAAGTAEILGTAGMSRARCCSFSPNRV